MSQQKISSTPVNVVLDFWEHRYLRENQRILPRLKGRPPEEWPAPLALPELRVTYEGEVVLNKLLSIRSDDDAIQFGREMFYAQREEEGFEKIAAVMRLRKWTQQLAVVPYAKWNSLMKLFWKVDGFYLFLQPLTFSVRWYQDTPCLELRTSFVEVAISGVLQLKELQGQRFRACARHDCARIYEVTSSHSRLYCTAECAHLVAIRRARTRTRELGALKTEKHRAPGMHTNAPVRRGA
jgi:hypothetical protein